MSKIVVLGGSFGGLTAAFELKRLLGKKADVTVVSDDDRFVFLPSLPWLIMGWRKPEDITLKVSEILRQKGIEFVHDAARQIDADKAKVITATGKELPYDHLVISTGPYLAFDEIPGLGPDKGYTASTFTLDHAVKTGATWRSVLENPGPIVLGSSQMVSCFGPSYELAFEMDADLRRRKMRHKVPILYLTSEPYLGHMGIGLGKSRRCMEDEFADRDIKPVVSQAIEEVTPGEIRLKDGTKLPFKLAMITPPFKGVPAVAPLGNPRGFIPVDKNYRHTKYRNIFAVGVAMAIAPPEVTPVPTGVPKTGFMTVQMAKTAAATIASDVTGRMPPLADEIGVICLMDMGNTAAFMKAYPVLPPRQSSYMKKAVWAKWLKVSFEKYFLFKMKHGISNWP